jgi:hypothetical protein
MLQPRDGCRHNMERACTTALNEADIIPWAKTHLSLNAKINHKAMNADIILRKSFRDHSTRET